MQIWRVPGFLPLKRTTGGNFIISNVHLKADLVDVLGSLRVKHAVTFLYCFCSFVGVAGAQLR